MKGLLRTSEQYTYDTPTTERHTMITNQKIEFYPLWIAENPELYKASKDNFLNKAKENGLDKVKEYWHCGLFYIEASK